MIDSVHIHRLNNEQDVKELRDSYMKQNPRIVFLENPRKTFPGTFAAVWESKIKALTLAQCIMPKGYQ